MEKLTCTNCPHRFECNLLSFSLKRREVMCLLLRHPYDYFNFSPTNKQIKIPENSRSWESRLLELQYYGDWVRDGERVGRIDSKADLSKYKICKSSKVISVVIEQYNEENKN